MEFGERLALLMKEHDISLAELSTETKIAKTTLHNILTGTDISLSKLKKLASYFECSIDSLVTGKKDKDPIEALAKSEIFSGLYEITVKRVSKKEE